MNDRDFFDLLNNRMDEGRFLCVGLDPVGDKMPTVLRAGNTPGGMFVRFCIDIIDATCEDVAAYKPNIAFFESYGSDGIKALEEVCAYLRRQFPEIPIILDAKRGDIGNTNSGYVALAFEELKVDAITLHPYLGREAMTPFLQYEDKGLIFLAKTSNSGSGEFQDLLVGNTPTPLWLHVGRGIAQQWNEHGNCALVIGATYPEELDRARKIIGDNMLFLVPGIGAQGGDLEAAAAAARNSEGRGVLFNSSRGIIYASNGDDFAEAAGKKAESVNAQIRAALAAGL